MFVTIPVVGISSILEWKDRWVRGDRNGWSNEHADFCLALFWTVMLLFFQDEVLAAKRGLLEFFWHTFGERTRLCGLALFLAGPVVLVLIFNVGSSLPLLVWLPVMLFGLMVTTMFGVFVSLSSPQ